MLVALYAIFTLIKIKAWPDAGTDCSVYSGFQTGHRDFRLEGTLCCIVVVVMRHFKPENVLFLAHYALCALFLSSPITNIKRWLHCIPILAEDRILNLQNLSIHFLLDFEQKTIVSVCIVIIIFLVDAGVLI